MNIAVFASHNGSDLQAIIDACKSGAIHARVCAVLSNNAGSRALQRAEEEGIRGYCVSEKKYGGGERLQREILEILNCHDTDILFLAGYLKKIGAEVLRKYENRVFNIHPALLPQYGGKGMYGIHVHQAVIDAKETVSGITVHRVNEAYDEGEIIAQTAVPVSPDDTAETLAARILEREHVFIVEAINQIISSL